MLWFYFALIHSFFRAAYSETSHIYKTDPWHMVLWQSLFAFAFLLLLTPFMAWPHETVFYFAAMAVGLMFAGGMLFQLNLTSMKLGRVLGIYIPIEAMVAFIIWSLLSPESWLAVAANPLWLVAIIALFIAGVIGLYNIRDNDINLRTLGYVAPIGISFAVAGVVTKLMIPAPGTVSSANNNLVLANWDILPYALTYVFFTYMVIIPVLIVVLFMKKKLGADFTARPNIRAGIMTGIFSALAYIAFVASVVLAVNPGFTSFVTILLPVWLLIFHKIDGLEEDADFRSAGLIALAVLSLAGLSFFL